MSRTLTQNINRWGTVVFSAMLLFLIACADAAGPGPNPIPHPAVARVAVSPQSYAVVVGSTLDLVSTAYDADDKAITGLQASWQSNRVDIATVSATGRLQAVALGTATITATIEGKSGSATITVMQTDVGPIVRIAIEPLQSGPLSLDEGSERALSGVAYDAAGRVVTREGFIWESSNTSVATVSTSGLVTALRPGSVAITAVLQQFGAAVSVDVWAAWSFDLLYDEVNAGGLELFALDLRERVGVPRLVLPEGTHAFDPTPSPDGTKLAYVVNEATRTAIYVANRDGSNPVSLMAAGFADQPTWSPDGLRLAFRYRATTTEMTDIWVADANGANAVSLTAEMGASSIEREPAWSPGGPTSSRIAFVHATATQDLIWSMRPDGIGKRRVTTTSGVRDGDPSWSPDATQLVFIRNGNLWMVGESGVNPHLFLELSGTQGAPAWSPDGKVIAFASTHEAPALLYTVWSDGTRLARRSGQGDFFGNVAWRVR